jgi:hypothetical protein
LKEYLEDDLDMFDGYEDLPDDLQQKVKKALEQGHVDDEDWKGVSYFIFSLYYIYYIHLLPLPLPKAISLTIIVNVLLGCGLQPTWDERLPCPYTQAKEEQGWRG